MQFRIEKISEDSIYSNLLLGLPKLINRYKKFGMKNYYLKRFPTVGETDIMEWEHNNGVLLPADMRMFYSSFNGFLFKWQMQLGQSPSEVEGKIEINGLEQLVQIPHTQNIAIIKDSITFRPSLGMDVKLFELTNFGSNHKVVIVFSKFTFANNVWICSNENKYFYLTQDFTSYFRMCLAHLGIPSWQLLYTSISPPQWIQNLVTLLLPTLLSNQMEREQQRKERCNARRNALNSIDSSSEVSKFVNKLDHSIFKGTLNIECIKPRLVNHRKKSNFSRSVRAFRERNFKR